MALLKSKEIREMSHEKREEKLREIRDELMHERGLGAMGGAPTSPGKIRALRKNIARMITIQREVEIASLNVKKEPVEKKEPVKKAPSKKKAASPSKPKPKKKEAKQ